MTTENLNELLRGSDFVVGICKQDNYRIINPNPVFEHVRRTDGKPTATINYGEDPSVDPDQQGAEQIMESKDLGAEINSVVSKQSIGFLEQAIFSSEELVTVTDTDIAATTTGFTSDSDGFGDFKVGDAFWLSGSSSSALEKLYIVKTVTDGEIVTTVAPPVTESAGATITLITRRYWSGKTPTYNIMQVYARDESAVDGIDCHTVYDAIFDSASIEVVEEGQLSFTGSLIAESEVDGHEKISGQTYADKSTDKSVTALAGSDNCVKGYYVNGEIASCLIKSLSLEIGNSGESDKAGACDSSLYVRGRPTFTGSTVVRSFASNPFKWRNYAREGERVQIGVHLSHGGGDETFIMMRRCVVTEATQADGAGTIANTEASFTCERDGNENVTIAIYKNWV